MEEAAAKRFNSYDIQAETMRSALSRKNDLYNAVIERLPGHTLLRVTPLTGRQHQIRVHLAAIGHPVLGDLLYKDESLFLAALEPGAAPPARHWLHARRASFLHPVTGAPIVIEAPIPPDLDLIVRRMRAPGAGAPPV